MNNKAPKISLIIPVYNTEKFLAEALKSVENQTFKDFEAIIINDGSTDNSGKIIDSFAAKNKSFRVINQDNKGLSAARNAGIKAATGQYIAFFDSDDYLSPDFLKELYKLASENQADIAYCNFYIYKNKSGFTSYMPFTAKSGVYSRKNALNKLILDITMHHFAWNKLFSRSLFTENCIEFPDMYYEDIATCPRLFFCANKIAVTSKALYYYRRHDDSIISLMTDEKINDLILSFGINRNFLEEKNIYKKYKLTFKTYALRLKIQVFYCILKEHIIHSKLKGFWVNLKRANASINMFLNNRYKPCCGLPILPFYVKIPYEERSLSENLPNT